MKKFLLLAAFSISSIGTLLLGSNMLAVKESIAAEQQAKQSGIYSYIIIVRLGQNVRNRLKRELAVAVNLRKNFFAFLDFHKFLLCAIRLRKFAENMQRRTKPLDFYGFLW